MENIESKIFDLENLSEKNHLVNSLKDPKYRGWYQVVLDTKTDYGTFKDLVVLFRMPSTLKLYDDVLRNFTLEERIIGVHRMLIGNDLKVETQELLQKYGNIEKCVAELEDKEVEDLLGRMKKIVTLNCNVVPYLHIRLEAKDKIDSNKNTKKIKEFVESHPLYLDILYDVLNKKISIEEATEKSNSIIKCEFADMQGNANAQN